MAKSLLKKWKFLWHSVTFTFLVRILPSPTFWAEPVKKSPCMLTAGAHRVRGAGRVCVRRRSCKCSSDGRLLVWPQCCSGWDVCPIFSWLFSYLGMWFVLKESKVNTLDLVMFIHIINLKFQYLIIFTQHRKPSHPSFYVHCIASFVKRRPKIILVMFALQVACPWLYKRFNQNFFKKSRFEAWEKQFMQFLALDITAEIIFLFPSQFLGWT